MRRFNSFGDYMRRRFGFNVYKVNIDAGFTCPNRDGTLGVTGCIYCNNESFKPSACMPTLTVREQVKKGIGYLRKRYGAERFLAYFQAYTNTYAPKETLIRLYSEAIEEPSVIGLAIGTRPDCIDEEKLRAISEIAKERFVLIEYGVQSIYEKTLSFIQRGHDYKTFLKAIEMTKAMGISVGGHIIVGFPTESKDEMLAMASEISHSGVEFLKIHQLQVVKNTPLAVLYEREHFHIFDYDEYIDFIVDFIERLSPDIVIQRLFATAPDAILMAPRWGRSRHEILNDIERRLKERDTYQGRLFETTILSHPKDSSLPL